MTKLLMTLLLLLSVASAGAQQVVSGVVKDRQTGHALSLVSITVEGSDLHTVTNEDGRFVLKVQHVPKYLQLSHIGYKTRRMNLDPGKTDGLQIMMVSNVMELQEVIVMADDPWDIVRAAMSRIERNYPARSELVRCFYRETARRGSRFISVAEAVTDMYKTSYQYGPDHDAVVIQKGRRLMSMKARDTLGVKIQGGPIMPLMADVVKNRDYMLNEEILSCCDLHMETPAKVDDRLHYVVRVEPHPVTFYPLMGGLLYIDQQTYTITRAELQLDVRDWRKASDYMLVRKPAGLRFRPKELTMTIAFTTDSSGITRMSYLRNEMRFTCDWKRRLFAAPFVTVSEMVVTDRIGQGDAAKRPRGRSTFGLYERFYDKVEYFEDPDFWADYNIIEPTESLEHAIGRLKKRVRN